MEIWKSIEGFEGIYEISNEGNVRSVDREIIHNTYKESAKPKKQSYDGKKITSNINNVGKGYVYVTLWLHSKHYKKFVHRLVANAFIPNPDGKPQVNHIDGNPQNNKAENLEWVTINENCKHAWDTNLIKTKKRVLATNKINGKTIEFDSLSDMAKHFGVNHSAISIALGPTKHGERRTTCGYYVEYIK